MDKGAWWATVHGVAKSWTQLRDYHTHTHTHTHTENIPLYVCTTSSLSVDGHTGCFLVLAVVNSAARNIGVAVSLIMVFSGSVPSSGIVGSYGSYVFTFVINLHTVLHSGSINLHNMFFSNTQWICQDDT